MQIWDFWKAELTTSGLCPKYWKVGIEGYGNCHYCIIVGFIKNLKK